MDVTLVHNPKAGHAVASRGAIEAALRREGFRCRHCTVPRLLRHPELLQKGEFVVVAGGDGSVRKVALQLIGTGRTLAILPAGTANNIASSLGVGGELKSVIARWKQSRPQPIDVGLAEGPWGSRYFVEGIGMGLLGRAIPIIEAIDSVSPHDFADAEAKLHRDLCVFIALAHEIRPLPVRLGVGRARLRSDRYLAIELLNIARAGPRLELVPQADPMDGRLDLVTVRAGDRERLVRALSRHLLPGRRGAVLKRKRVTDLRVELLDGVVRIDDRIAWRPTPRLRRARFSVRVVRGALHILLPERG
ncbi:MAG TPA: diacylglycerol kinase family protein [Opitutaceae bacterium]|jgi:diacylglycerol kinase family enzyme